MLPVLQEAGAIMPRTRWDMEIEPYFSSEESESRPALIPKSASLPLRENVFDADTGRRCERKSSRAG